MKMARLQRADFVLTKDHNCGLMKGNSVVASTWMLFFVERQGSLSKVLTEPVGGGGLFPSFQMSTTHLLRRNVRIPSDQENMPKKPRILLQ